MVATNFTTSNNFLIIYSIYVYLSYHKCIRHSTNLLFKIVNSF
nr:MAG TPA: hypothetical protein [Caudoviricetes sp.]